MLRSTNYKGVSDMPKLAAQLYTIRDHLKSDEDFAQSMKKIADIGYRYVQVSGIGEISWEKMKDALDANQLSCEITHVPLEAILEKPEEVIANHKLLGFDIIGIGGGGAYIGAGEMTTAIYDEYIAKLKQAGQLIKDAGLKFAYHNHHFEFKGLDNGQLGFDYLAEQVPADLMGFTLDVYWLQYAGVAVLELLERYADRILCIHLKDYRINAQNDPEYAEVGHGNMNWTDILAVCKKHQLDLLAVEQDTTPGDPFESLKMSYDYLRDTHSLA